MVKHDICHDQGQEINILGLIFYDKTVEKEYKTHIFSVIGQICFNLNLIKQLFWRKNERAWPDSLLAMSMETILLIKSHFYSKIGCKQVRYHSIILRIS